MMGDLPPREGAQTRPINLCQETAILLFEEKKTSPLLKTQEKDFH